MHAVRRVENVNLQVPSGNGTTKLQFPDIPQLRNDSTKEIVIKSIQVFCAPENTFDWNQKPVATLAQITNAYLTLFVDGEQSINNIPLVRLHNTNNSTDAAFTGRWQQDIMEFKDIKIDWTKSFVVWGADPSINALTTIEFLVTYEQWPPGTFAAIKAARLEALTRGIVLKDA